MTDDNIAARRQPPIPSPTKLAWIAGLAIATLMPTLLVAQLTSERQDRADAVAQDIAASWGPNQIVTGPTLVLAATAKDGSARYVSLAPRTLDVKAVVEPTTRRRGIFSAAVYQTKLTMTGRFELPAGFREGGSDTEKPGQTVLLEGLAGIQGAQDEDHVEIGDAKSPWMTCADILTNETACQGDRSLLAAAIDLSNVSGGTVPFSLTLHVRGTGSLRLASAAKHTTSQITGAWASPSFVGTDLPTATKVSGTSFEANWSIDRLGRPVYTQGMRLSADIGISSTIGVELVESVPIYRTISRVTKYSLLIVVLAFAAYFLLEMTAGVRVALFQYGMLGASISLFTLLLLSLSEIVGYEAGFAIGATMVTAQAAAYTFAVTRRPKAAGVFAGMLAMVFAFFYALVGLESYALVVGALALFVVLSIVMSATQKVFGDHERVRSLPIIPADLET